jgi:hypothetical protein
MSSPSTPTTVTAIETSPGAGSGSAAVVTVITSGPPNRATSIRLMSPACDVKPG